MTPRISEASQLASIAGHASWKNCPDRTARARPGQQGLWRRFEDEVDPNRVLSPAERYRRAKSAQSEHMRRLALARSRSLRQTRVA